MFSPLRLAVAAAVLVGLAAPAPAAPPGKAVEEVLTWVPTDAALFFHVDVPTVWKSKQLADARKANPSELFSQLNDLATAIGIQPESVASFTVFMPKLKGPGDQSRVCLAFTLSKPYNAKQVAGGLNALAELDKIPRDFKSDRFKKEREGVYSIVERGPVRPAPPKGEKEAKKDEKESPKTLFLFDNPDRIVILGPQGNDLAKPFAGDKAGPIADALAAARAGKTAALGLNFANLPDEIRQENLPPQAEPFKPLIHSDAIIGTAELAADLVVNVHVKCAGRPKALEAEKSMGVAKVLFQTLLAAAVGELTKNKDEGNAKLVDTVKAAQEVVRTAKLTSDETTATATLKAKADFDVTPIFGFFTRTGQAAARASTVNNLKQIGLAMHNYHEVYNGLPAAAIIGKKGKPLLSWRVAVLPFVEQDALYRQFKLDEPWDSDHNKKLLDTTAMPRVFAVEGVTKPTDKTTHVQVFRGNGAMFDLVQGHKLQSIADGTSNTFMVVMGKTAVPWTKPDDIEYDPKKEAHDFFLWVNDVTNIAFGDGSVRTVSKKAKAASLHALITKAGGEVANVDD
jgi:hypothetical protein